MTTDIDDVMQAAERWAMDSPDAYKGPLPDGWDRDEWAQLCRRADAETLADFALSILPKGKRPVPITEFPLNVGIVPVWSIRTGLQQLFLRSGELYPYQSLAERGEPKDWMSHRPVYTNRGDAVLAMNWKKFDELHRAAFAS